MHRLSYYLNLAYLLNLRPEPLGPAGRLLLPALVVLLLVGGALLRGISARTSDPIRRAGYRRMSQPLVAMGIVFALYTLPAWVGAPILSLRLLLLGGVAALVVWVGVVLRVEARTQPIKQAERERRLQLERYLPK